MIVCNTEKGSWDKAGSAFSEEGQIHYLVSKASRSLSDYHSFFYHFYDLFHIWQKTHRESENWMNFINKNLNRKQKQSRNIRDNWAIPPCSLILYKQEECSTSAPSSTKLEFFSFIWYVTLLLLLFHFLDTSSLHVEVQQISLILHLVTYPSTAFPFSFASLPVVVIVY